jgi:O-antigen/teichoic acid export membrane protein
MSEPDTGAPAIAEQASDGAHIDRTALRAGGYVIVGHGLAQLIRLGGNLVLTRLLAPELFAVMTIAQVFYLGLGFLSDIGLGPAIVRSNRAHEEIFLNTSWTLQIIRGSILWVLTCALAFPVAAFYHEPILRWVLPALGLNAILTGFNATALVTYQRELRQGRLVLIEIVVQVLSLGASLAIAYLFRSVWALVAGSLVSSLVTMAWSHRLKTPVRNRIMFEKKAARELLSFGLWILFSTAMMFLATQADRLILGRLFPLAFFGVYGIAAALAELPKDIVGRLGERVLYPLFAKLSSVSRDEFRRQIARRRRILLFPMAVLVALLACFGDYLVLFLYDTRYSQAAWILPLLAVGMWPLVLYSTIDRSLYVIGKPSYVSIGNLAKFVYMLVLVPLMFHFAGVLGAVVVVVLNDLPIYVIVVAALRREKLLLLRQDALATLLLIAVVAIALAARLVTGLGLPGQSVFSAL